MTTGDEKQGRVLRALRAAWPATLPVMAGYLFLGLAYGVYMHAAGFAWYYPALMAMCIYGGSLEFVAVSMLLAPFAPLQTLCVALLIQARHLFYGIALLDRYRGTGIKKPLLIFWLSDETFAVNCSMQVPEGVDRGRLYFFVSALDWSYWVAGSTLGGLISSGITCDLRGLDFVLTAMFTAILTDQWLREKSHISAWLGVAVSGLCLGLFGAESFLIPTMVLLVLLLLGLRRPLERRLG